MKRSITYSMSGLRGLLEKVVKMVIILKEKVIKLCQVSYKFSCDSVVGNMSYYINLCMVVFSHSAI